MLTRKFNNASEMNMNNSFAGWSGGECGEETKKEKEEGKGAEAVKRKEEE